MFFKSVFTKETYLLPEFYTPSENTIDSVSISVDKVESKLKVFNPYKSAAVDKLHLRILIICTKSFIEGQFPQNWNLEISP